jgi:tetratricopeptide (TPR) repeat protein
MKRLGRIDMLIELLKKEPSDLFLNYALGLEYATELVSAPDAETQFKKVLDMDENYLAAYYQLGKLYESLLRTGEALETYKLGLEKARIQKNNKAINEFGEAIFMLEDE